VGRRADVGEPEQAQQDDRADDRQLTRSTDAYVPGVDRDSEVFRIQRPMSSMTRPTPSTTGVTAPHPVVAGNSDFLEAHTQVINGRHRRDLV
jgi:hypothetical protein